VQTTKRYKGHVVFSLRKLLVLNTVVWSQKVLDWSGATKRHVTHHKTIADESLYKGPDAPLPGADTSGWTWDEDAVEKKAFISGWECKGEHVQQQTSCDKWHVKDHVQNSLRFLENKLTPRR
jgi:hypothetical protein